MSVSEYEIKNPKKQLEFYKDLSEQLQQENKQLKEQKNKALNYIKNYNSMEFRYQDSKVIDKLNIIKNILNNRLDFEDEDIEIIKLKNQLKQRDEVIKNIKEYIEFLSIHHLGIMNLETKENNLGFVRFKNTIWGEEMLDILDEYKGDNNENL